MNYIYGKKNTDIDSDSIWSRISSKGCLGGGVKSVLFESAPGET